MGSVSCFPVAAAGRSRRMAAPMPRSSTSRQSGRLGKLRETRSDDQGASLVR